MDANTNRNARQALRRAAPWVAIAALISATQAVRAQWADAALFLIAAVALAVDAAQRSPLRPVHWRPGRLTTAVSVLVAGIALSLAPRYSVPMGIGLVVVGVLAVPFAWAEPQVGPAGADREPAVRRSALAWAIALVVACVCELAAFIFGRVAPQRSAEFPSISMVLDPLLRQPWPRAVFILGWLALGVLLVRPAVRRSIAGAGTRAQGRRDVHRSQRTGGR